MISDPSAAAAQTRLLSFNRTQTRAVTSFLTEHHILRRCLYMVWQKSNETNFLLTMNFILFTNKGYPIQNVPLGSYTVTEALFPLFVAVLEGFCWYTFQFVGYALLDIIQFIKMAPSQVVFETGE